MSRFTVPFLPCVTREYISCPPSGSVALNAPVTEVFTGVDTQALLATGGWFTLTVTLTVSNPVAPWLSVTVSLKVNTVATLTEGAVKPAVAVLAPLSVTVGPTVWVQA